ncbi:MAG: PDZ domain-containing protein [Calditrichae bacterium]|nr:PDZ domain-containing protein [Calditrichia bacterium]
MSQRGQSVGFAIPINSAKRIVESIKEHGRIVRPWLGVRYMIINDAIAKENNLSVNYGALIVRGRNPGDIAVIPASPADKAGLLENDIILEIEGERVDEEHPLAVLIAQYNPGDNIKLKVLSKGEEKTVIVTLEEYAESTLED